MYVSSSYAESSVFTEIHHGRWVGRLYNYYNNYKVKLSAEFTSKDPLKATFLYRRWFWQNIVLPGQFAWSDILTVAILDISSVYHHWNQVGSPGSRFVRVIQIRPGLKIIWVWLLRCEIKKTQSGSTTMATKVTFASWVTPTFWSNDICLLLMHGEPRPFLCIWMQQLPFTACSELHPLICCCSRSSTPAVSQGIFTCSWLIACTKPLPPIQAILVCLQAYG